MSWRPVAEVVTGRTDSRAGADWSRSHTVSRWQGEGSRAEWILTVGICNGTADGSKTYRRKRDALAELAALGGECSACEEETGNGRGCEWHRTQGSDQQQQGERRLAVALAALLAEGGLREVRHALRPGQEPSPQLPASNWQRAVLVALSAVAPEFFDAEGMPK